MSALTVAKRLRNGGQPDMAAEVEEFEELLSWAYRKLMHVNFTKMDDAMAMDRIEAALGKYDEFDPSGMDSSSQEKP